MAFSQLRSTASHQWLGDRGRKTTLSIQPAKSGPTDWSLPACCSCCWAFIIFLQDYPSTQMSTFLVKFCLIVSITWFKVFHGLTLHPKLSPTFIKLKFPVLKISSSRPPPDKPHVSKHPTSFQSSEFWPLCLFPKGIFFSVFSARWSPKHFSKMRLKITFWRYVDLHHIWDFTYKWYHVVFVFLSLTDFPLVWQSLGLFTSLQSHISMKQKQIHRYREKNCGCQGGTRNEREEWVFWISRGKL